MDAYFLEKHIKDIAVKGAVGGGISSDRVDMSKGDRLAITLFVDSDATDLNLTLRQHDAASAGTSKDLETKRSYFVKPSATAMVRKEQAALSANIVEADLNGSEGFIVLEVLGEDLDVDGGFSFVSVDIAARAGNVLGEYEVHQVRIKPGFENVIK